MAFKNDGAFFRQALSNAGTLEVRAGHFVAERQQHFSNAAHADAANPDEMYPLNFCKHFSGRFATNRYTALLTSNFFCACCIGLAALVGLAPLVQNLCSLRSRPLRSFVESIYQMLLILAARRASR